MSRQGAPGLATTEMTADRWRSGDGERGASVGAVREETLTPHLGAPEDVGETAAVLAGDAARFVTGQVLPVDGGWSV